MIKSKTNVVFQTAKLSIVPTEIDRAVGQGNVKPRDGNEGIV